MSASWNSKINACFRDSHMSNNSGSAAAGSVLGIDFAFHTLDKLPQEPQSEKKFRPVYRPRRRKTAKEIADLKRIDEIIARSSTFMPRKLEMPINYFEGTGVNPYKTENSKEGRATTEMAKESRTKDEDENLDEVFHSRCVISKPKPNPEMHLKDKAVPQLRSLSQNSSSFIPETSSQVQVSHTSEVHKVISEGIPAPHYKKNNSSNAWRGKQHHITSSFTKNITSAKFTQNVNSTYSRDLSHSHQTHSRASAKNDCGVTQQTKPNHSRASPASINASSYCSKKVLNCTSNAKKGAVKL